MLSGQAQWKEIPTFDSMGFKTRMCLRVIHKYANCGLQAIQDASIILDNYLYWWKFYLHIWTLVLVLNSTDQQHWCIHPSLLSTPQSDQQWAMENIITLWLTLSLGDWNCWCCNRIMFTYFWWVYSQAYDNWSNHYQIMIHTCHLSSSHVSINWIKDQIFQSITKENGLASVDNHCAVPNLVACSTIINNYFEP